MAFAFVANSVKAYPEGAEAPFRNCFEQILEFNVTAVNTDQELDLAAIAALDATNGPQVLSALAKVSRMNGCLVLQSARASAGAYATGNATITNVANLLAGAGDTITVAGVGFVAQAAAVVAGDATFRATVDVTTTAASLAAQINAHATTSALVTASPALGVVTITAKQRGAGGNSIALAYTDAGAEIGATVSGAALSGGTPTAGYSIHGTAKAPVFAFPGATATPTALHFVLRYRLAKDETPFIYNAV
jgi:phage tail sheath gpL-like